jgi:hypothetical protein
MMKVILQQMSLGRADLPDCVEPFVGSLLLGKVKEGPPRS